MASLYVRQDSPFWWLRAQDKNGKWKGTSTGFRRGNGPETRLARALEAKHTMEELERSPTTKGATWSWVDDYLKLRVDGATLERYRCCWLMLDLFLKEKEIPGPMQLRREHCFDYCTWRQVPDKANGKYQAGLNTALLELKVLRLVMGEAVNRGYCQGNPVLQLGIKKAPRKLKKELTDDDCEAIRTAIAAEPEGDVKRMLHYSFEIARNQGCRLKETRLDPNRDVEIFVDPATGQKAGRICFHTKGGKEFTTVLHPNLIPLFEDLRARKQKSTWSDRENAGRQWASTNWTRFLKRAGLQGKGICFHSTRVTVVTELARNNVPISKSKSFVGHASTTIHELYQRLQPDDVSGVVNFVGQGKRPST